VTTATSKNTPHPSGGSRYGPTPTAPGGAAQRQPAVREARKENDRWTAAGGPDQQPTIPPSPSVCGQNPRAATGMAALAGLPEVLTVREAAAILRVGRNQLYQAVERGQLRAVRIGRSIRIPTQALLNLLGYDNLPAAGSDE
jgi:excisionase family DNA binding protein